MITKFIVVGISVLLASMSGCGSMQSTRTGEYSTMIGAADSIAELGIIKENGPRDLGRESVHRFSFKFDKMPPISGITGTGINQHLERCDQMIVMNHEARRMTLPAGFNEFWADEAFPRIEQLHKHLTEAIKNQSEGKFVYRYTEQFKFNADDGPTGNCILLDIKFVRADNDDN